MSEEGLGRATGHYMREHGTASLLGPDDARANDAVQPASAVGSAPRPPRSRRDGARGASVGGCRAGAALCYRTLQWCRTRAVTNDNRKVTDSLASTGRAPSLTPKNPPRGRITCLARSADVCSAGLAAGADTLRSPVR